MIIKTFDKVKRNETAEKAKKLMLEHKFGCSESLMLAFQDTCGEDIISPQMVAMSSAFRGGIGGAGCVCGALAAAQMVMGLIWGYQGGIDGSQNADEVKMARSLCKEVHDSFRQANGSTCCAFLTKDLPAGSEERVKYCAELCHSAAFAAGEIIARMGRS